MKAFDEITIEELDELIDNQKKSPIYNHINEESFEALKPQLLKHYESLRDRGSMNGDDLLNYENHPNFCACLGPRPGFTVCPCSIRMYMEAYRFYLAKYLITVEG